MVADLAAEIKQPHLLEFIRRFLYDQLHIDSSSTSSTSSDTPLSECPLFRGQVSVLYTATACFYSPSDQSGTKGMRREIIRAVPSWRNGPPRNDCVFLNNNPNLPGMRGLDVVRVLLFLSFEFGDKTFPCALVRWYSCIGDEPDEDTGMWIVEPQSDANGISLVHVDCIIRAAHLIGVYGREFIPKDLKFYHSLDAFHTFYVNKFADHNAFEIAF
jgi:hypothetical protein